MLVLTRATDEAISLGDDVIFRVARIATDSVDLAITAPANLSRRILPQETAIPADQEVVSLSVNETLQLGEAIRVTVVMIRAGRVRLGIDYPEGMMPHRID